MTLPRRLTLAGDDDVRVEPAGDIESLRYDHRHIGGDRAPRQRGGRPGGHRGQRDGAGARARPRRCADGRAETSSVLQARRSTRASPSTRTAASRSRTRPSSLARSTTPARSPFRGFKGPRPVDRFESLLTLDSSYSSTLPGALSRAPETAPIRLDPDEPLQLRVFVDRSVVEVFANGRQCVAVRVYPGRGDSTGVSLRAQGNPARLRSLDAWKMRSVYT